VVPAPLLLLEAEQQPAVYRRGASSLLGPPCSSKQRAAPAWDEMGESDEGRRGGAPIVLQLVPCGTNFGVDRLG
jgi:hypothetical protein